MTNDTKNTLISLAIDFVCGAVGALAVLFSIKLMLKIGLGQLCVFILMMIPSYILGTKLSAWVKTMRLNKI
jgi:hypothetical protein